MARSDFLLVLAVHGATQAKENVKVHLWFFFFVFRVPTYLFLIVFGVFFLLMCSI
jgi:hypothetical protein